MDIIFDHLIRWITIPSRPGMVSQQSEVSPGHCFKQTTQGHCLSRPSLVENVFYITYFSPDAICS